VSRPDRAAVDDALYEAGVITGILQHLGARMIAGEDVCGTGIVWLADQLDAGIDTVKAGQPPFRRELADPA